MSKSLNRKIRDIDKSKLENILEGKDDDYEVVDTKVFYHIDDQIVNLVIKYRKSETYFAASEIILKSGHSTWKTKDKITFKEVFKQIQVYYE